MSALPPFNFTGPMTVIDLTQPPRRSFRWKILRLAWVKSDWNVLGATDSDGEWKHLRWGFHWLTKPNQLAG